MLEGQNSSVGFNPDLKEAGDSPGQIGFEIFIDAARRCPGSVMAEAALVADKAQEMRISPLSLGNALLENDQLVSSVRRAALSQHRKYSNGPRDLVRLPEATVRNVINSVFRIAARLEDLSPEDLRRIYTDIYSIFSGSDLNSEQNPDDGISIIVGRMLAEARKRKVTE